MTYKAYDNIDIAPVVDTNAYTANDVVGGLIELYLPRFYDGLVVNSVRVFGNTQSPALSLWFFSSAPTATYTNNAAFAPSAADLQLTLGTAITVAATDYATVNSLTVARVQDVNRVLTVDATTQRLWVVIVTSSTPTFTTTTSLNIRLTTIS